MLLHLVSDIHLEFGPCPTPPGGEVLVLAGDIHVGTYALDWIQKCLAIYDQVYYVLGNHEFYNHNMQKVQYEWAKIAAGYKNFEVLDDRVHAYDGVRFIGSTMWTAAIIYGMNDYQIIQHGNDILQPVHTQMMHHISAQWIEDALAQPWEGETVVITHHAPTPECVVPKFNGNKMNPCFHAHMNRTIAENDIKYWLHGHMHDSIFVEQDGTEIHCNPRGYAGYGANTGFRNPLVLEV
jgi:Icc-related predicted phosphoesterase